MKTNKYIKPVTKYLLTDSDQLLASMSTHDEIGGDQLSKEWFESSEQEESLPKQPNVWDE
jgi:hypothetical protein